MEPPTIPTVPQIPDPEIGLSPFPQIPVIKITPIILPEMPTIPAIPAIPSSIPNVWLTPIYYPQIPPIPDFPELSPILGIPAIPYPNVPSVWLTPIRPVPTLPDIPLQEIPSIPHPNIPNIWITPVTIPSDVPQVPQISFPQIPPISVPQIPIPNIPQLPNIQITPIPDIPQIEYPQVPELGTTPFPQIPELRTTPIDIPQLEMPQIPNLPQIPSYPPSDIKRTLVRSPIGPIPMPIEQIEQQLGIQISPKIRVYVDGIEVQDGTDLGIYGYPGEKIDVKVLFEVAGTSPYGNHKAKVTFESDNDAIPNYHLQGEGKDEANFNANGNRVDFSWTPAAASGYSMLVEYRGDLESLTWKPVKINWTTSTLSSNVSLEASYLRIPFGAVLPIKTKVSSAGVGIDAGRIYLRINNSHLTNIGTQLMSYVQDLDSGGCEDIVKGCDCSPPGVGEICGDFCVKNPRIGNVDYILTSNGESQFVVLPSDYVSRGASISSLPAQIAVESIYDGNAIVRFEGFRCSDGNPYYCSNCSGINYPCKVRCWSFGNVYNSDFKSINILVDKNKTQLNISSIPTQIETYQDINIEARLTHEDVTSPSFSQVLYTRQTANQIKIKVGQQEYPISSTNGVFNLTLLPRTLKPGTYNVTVDYIGDADHYPANPVNSVLVVSPNQTTIDVTVTPASNFKTLTNGSINITLSDEVGPLSGSVKVFLDNTLLTTVTTDSNGKKTIPISGTQLKVGPNTITVEYVPDEYHTTSSDAVTFTVSKIITDITLGTTFSQINRLESVELSGKLIESDASAGFTNPLQTTVTFNIAGTTVQKQTDSSGSFKLTVRGIDLPIGNNVIGVMFPESAIYLGDSASVTVDVIKITPEITFFAEPVSISIFEQSIISGNIKDEIGPLANVPVKIQYLTTQQELQTDAGGNFQVTLLGSEAPLGQIGFQAIFVENDIYTNATAAVTVTVRPANSVLEWVSPSQSVFTEKDVVFEGLLKANELPLANATINVSINNNIGGNITSGADGRFQFVTNFDVPATYTVAATYDGTSDGRIIGDSASFDVIAAIQPPDEYTSILDATYDDKTDVLDVTLKSEFGTCIKNVPIKLKIDGKPQSDLTTDENGKVTKTLDLEAGTHTLVVTYEGSITPRLVCKMSTKSFDVSVSLYRALGKLVPISSQHIIYGVGALVGIAVLMAILKRKDDF